MKVNGIFAAAVLMALAGPVMAQDPDVDCATDETQLALNFCSYQDWEAEDKKLNAVYGKARAFMQDMDANLPKAERGAADILRDAQRAWLVFRDVACKAEGFTWQGGSGQPMAINMCLTRLTKARMKDLVLLYAEN